MSRVYLTDTTKMLCASKIEMGKRRKVSLIEGNAKCRHIKINLYRDFVADVYLSEATPLYTLYMCMQVYLFTQGRGEGGKS
jgi:hypothetical protein